MRWSNRKTKKAVVSSIFSVRERNLKPNIRMKNRKERSRSTNCPISTPMNLQKRMMETRHPIWMRDLETVRTEVKNKNNSCRQNWRKLTLSHRLIKVELQTISRVKPTLMKCSTSKQTTTAIRTLLALPIGKTQSGEVMRHLAEVYTLYVLTV